MKKQKTQKSEPTVKYVAPNIGNVQNPYDVTFHLIDPALKNKEWALEYIKAQYPTFTTIFGSPMWNGQFSYDLLRAYGQGKQPMQIYQDQFNPQGYAASKAGGTGGLGAYGGGNYTGLSWNINSPATKYKHIILAELEKMNPEIECEAIDELASDQRKKSMELLKAQKPADQFLAQVSQKLNMPKPMKSGFAKKALGVNNNMSQFNDIEFDFDSDVELQMYMDIYYKQAVEIANEMSINTVFKQQRFDQKLKDVRNDALDFGVAGFWVRMDANTCMPKIDWVDMTQVLVGVGRARDFGDIREWAYPQFMTINELIGFFGTELQPTDVKEIFQYGVVTYGYFHGGNYDRNWRNGGGNNFNWEKISRIDFDRVRVKVAYFAFTSQNAETAEYAKVKYGETKVKSRPYGYTPDNDNDVVVHWGQVVYKGYYVVGMDKIYQFGMLPNMVRREGEEQQVKLDLQLYKFTEKSFVENMIPFLDGIQIAWLKLQMEVLMALPAGYEVDWDKLLDVPMGDGGKLDPLQLLQMFSQTGRLIKRSVDEFGNLLPNAQMPAVTRMENGIAKAVEGYVRAIQFYTSQLEAAIGFNPLAAGNAPQPRTSATGEKIAAQAVDNVNYHLVSGMMTLTQNVGIYVSSLVQQMAIYKGDGWEALKLMIGGVNTAIMESMDDIAAHRFGVYIKEKVSDEDMMQFKQFVMDAYSKNEIDLSDVILVWFLDNYKQAIQLFNLKRSKQIAKNQQMQMQGLQMQQKTQEEMNQLKLQLAQIEAQAKLQSADITGKSAISVQQLKQTGNYNQHITDNDLKLQQIQAKGNIELQKAQIQKQ